MPVVSGLSLGVHTVKIRNASASYTDTIYGFEILNESTSLSVPTGSAFVDRKKVVHNALISESYDSGFESGVLGTKGGHVLTYLKSDGNIGKAITPTDISTLYTTNVDHSNEEMIRKYHWREFGCGRADDFSMFPITGSNFAAFTLDDGTTTLTVATGNANSANGDGIVIGNASGELTFTFVGTGVDVIGLYDYGNAGTFDAATYYIDGVSVGTQVFNGAFEAIYPIASGLPYGTHILKIKNPASFAGQVRIVGGFKVHQPKVPNLPVGAIKLSSYCLLASYIANTSNGDEYLGVGVLRKQIMREFSYQGSNWIFSAFPSSVTSQASGWHLYNPVNGDSAELTFIGTGIDWRMDGSGWGVSISGLPFGRYTIRDTQISSTQRTLLLKDGNGSTVNMSLYTTSAYNGITFVASTGVVTHAASTNHSIQCADIIAPIYSYKSNIDASYQNTLSVGSQSICDERALTAIKEDIVDIPNWFEAVGIASGPSSTATSPTIMPDMFGVIKTSGRPIDIYFHGVFRHDTPANLVYLFIYVNGVMVADIDIRSYASSGSCRFPASMHKRIELAAGTHLIQAKFSTNSGTFYANATQRLLTVREEK